MKVNVKQHTEFGKSGHINAIHLVHKTDDVIILHLDMKTKNKGVDAYSTGSNVQSVWVGGDEVQIALPPEFHHNIVFAESSRYEIYVCIFRFQLLEEMTYSKPYETVTLWEKP